MDTKEKFENFMKIVTEGGSRVLENMKNDTEIQTTEIDDMFSHTLDGTVEDIAVGCRITYEIIMDEINKNPLIANMKFTDWYSDITNQKIMNES